MRHRGAGFLGTRSLASVGFLITTGAANAEPELSEEQLEKQTQNPVAGLISRPFQNNTSYRLGPVSERRTS